MVLQPRDGAQRDETMSDDSNDTEYGVDVTETRKTKRVAITKDGESVFEVRVRKGAGLDAVADALAESFTESLEGL